MQTSELLYPSGPTPEGRNPLADCTESSICARRKQSPAKNRARIMFSYSITIHSFSVNLYYILEGFFQSVPNMKCITPMRGNTKTQDNNLRGYEATTSFLADLTD